MKLMNKSKVTIEKYLNNLMLRNWIGYNPESNYYFIRSYDNVLKIERISGNWRASVKLDHILNIKALLGVIIFGNFYRIARNKRKKTDTWKKNGRKKSGLIKSCPKQKILPTHFQVSINGVSKLTGITENKLFRIKSSAVSANLLDVRKHYKKLLIPKSEWPHIIKNASQHTGKIFTNYDGLFLTLPDLVRPSIEFKRTRNVK